jgi:hypothetical protein
MSSGIIRQMAEVSLSGTMNKKQVIDVKIDSSFLYGQKIYANKVALRIAPIGDCVSCGCGSGETIATVIYFENGRAKDGYYRVGTQSQKMGDLSEVFLEPGNYRLSFFGADSVPDPAWEIGVTGYHHRYVSIADGDTLQEVYDRSESVPPFPSFPTTNKVTSIAGDDFDRLINHFRSCA